MTFDNSKKKEGGHPKKWKALRQGNKKEVEFKGHTWYWCAKDTGGKCKKWRAQHKPKECKGLATSAAGDKQNRESIGPDKRKSIKKKLKDTKTYIAKMKQFAEKDTTTEDEDSEWQCGWTSTLVVQTLLTMCWSLPNIIAILLKMTNKHL